MKQKPKRDKAYRPRLTKIPVMAELQKEFMFAGHGALASLRLAPNRPAFDQLATLFNVVHVALRQSGRKSVILESGMRAMQDVSKRDNTHGVLQLGRFELPPIENAMLECESILRELDILGLYIAHLKTRALERLSMTHTTMEAA